MTFSARNLLLGLCPWTPMRLCPRPLHLKHKSGNSDIQVVKNQVQSDIMWSQVATCRRHRIEGGVATARP